MFINRCLESRIRNSAKQFPVLLITGARQTGKTTLLKHVFPEYQYISLDKTALTRSAKENPERFLLNCKPPVIFDEIQNVPELLPYIKAAVDADRHSYGQYVMTGSQALPLMQGVSESLAGRVAILSLYPCTWKETLSAPNRTPGDIFSNERMAEQTVRGFYPEFLVNPGLDAGEWYSSYLTTYLERDVRKMKNIGDLLRFQTFIELLAARAGNLLNLSEVGRDCGISQTTAKSWLSILQATYFIYLLRPWAQNRTKRVMKSPKLYFADTGLLCNILGVDSADRFFKAPEGPAVFENMVIMEVVKQLACTGNSASCYFYRTASGVEVDLLVKERGETFAYEIKNSLTFNSRMADGLKRFEKEHPFSSGKILTLEKEILPVTKTISRTHWSAVIEA